MVQSLDVRMGMAAANHWRTTTQSQQRITRRRGSTRRGGAGVDFRGIQKFRTGHCTVSAYTSLIGKCKVDS